MASNIDSAISWARNGGRVQIDGKNAWMGLGNRAGLHDYATELIDEKWKKSGARFEEKIRELPEGTKVMLLSFHNINRDRGRWIQSVVITVKTNATLAGRR